MNGRNSDIRALAGLLLVVVGNGLLICMQTVDGKLLGAGAGRSCKDRYRLATSLAESQMAIPC